MVIQLYSGCIMKEWHIVFCGNLPEQDSLIVVDEEASFNLADDPAVFYLKQLILQLGS